MQKNFVMIDSQLTVKEAADKMKELNVGLLLVKEGNNITGIITERDIAAKVLAKGLDPQKTRTEEIITTDMAYCNQNDSIEEAAKQMEEQKVNRMMVIDDDNKPVGVLSISDFARNSGEESSYPEFAKKSEDLSEQKFSVCLYGGYK